MNYLLIGGIVVGAIAFLLFVAWSIGMVVVGESQVGIITKNFGKSLPNGRIIALDGEAGIQVDTLAPGWHFFYWPWQYSIRKIEVTVVPKGEIALIIANDGKELPVGRRFGTKAPSNSYQDGRAFLLGGGCKGQQLDVLTTGLYRINTELFTVITSANCGSFGLSTQSMTVMEVAPNSVGIVTTLDGKELPAGENCAPIVDGHASFQNPHAFVENGGFKGLQEEVLRSGSWIINPWFAKVSFDGAIQVPMAHVGVVFSAVGPHGDDVSGEAFKNGELVDEGFRGVWTKVKQPGIYPVNTKVIKIEFVQTSSIVLNWSDSKHEEHGLDTNLGTLLVQSKDGFTFPLEVQQVIHIPYTEAPKIIAQFGSVKQLVSQVLEPMIGNYFRNAVQNIDAKEFFNSREERQTSAQKYISNALKEYNVIGVGTYIGEMKPPAELMKTLQERKLAEEGAITIAEQTKREVNRQEKERQTALADSQHELVASEREVQIAEKKSETAKIQAEAAKQVKIANAEAEGETRKIAANSEGEALRLRSTNEADSIKLLAEATASRITLEGEAQANVTRKQIDAIGQSGYAAIEVAKSLSSGNLKLVPDIMLGGNGGGSSPSEVLLSTLALERVTGKSIPEMTAKAPEA